MLYHYLVAFAVNFLVGVALNAMNLLAYRFDDLYLSLTLVYGGLLMASHMIWSHQVVNYFAMGSFKLVDFLVGIGLSGLITLVMRQQIGVDDKQYLRRMISHHSTALTTSHRITRRTRNPELKRLADGIIATQEKEIRQMKAMIR
jgi:uncharacterized membrane protein YgaE (UPF0421/DUF939 family)